MSSQFKRQSAAPGLIRGLRGIIFDEGATVPADGSIGYSKGCIFLDNDASAGAQLWINSGSNTSSTFINYSGSLNLAGLTATVAELNTMAGITASTAELNRTAKNSSRVVLAGGTLTVTQALHDGATVAMPAVCAVTLPAATGTGARYKFYQKIAATAVTLTATAADMYGVAWLMSDNSAAALAYNAAGSTVITFDGSTKGGVKGAIVEIEDVAASLLLVRVMSAASGSEATPFS